MEESRHYVMEMDWEGKEDRFIETLPKDKMVFEYMEDNDFMKIKNSTVLFKRGNIIRYVTYGDIDGPGTVRPKLKNYYDTFEF